MNRGEVEDFEQFVAGRSPALLRTAYLLTGDAHAAEDLLQTALAKTLRHWRRVRDKQSLDAFVRSVMVNERRSWFRRRSSGEVPSDPALQLADRPVDDESGRVADLDELRRALLTLPPRQRAVVVLRYFDDLPEAEVAALLGCSVGTVKSQASKALVKLRVALDPALPNLPKGALK